MKYNSVQFHLLKPSTQYSELVKGKQKFYTFECTIKAIIKKKITWKVMIKSIVKNYRGIEILIEP